MVYLHVPFCDSKCFYCAFNSYTNRHELITTYMNALEKHLRYELERFATPKGSLTSLFIGGGTPSCVPAPLYEPLFTLLSPYLAANAEITIEANPNSATKEWLQTMKSFGVNRVSFGVQSFDNKKLAFLGRAHDEKEAFEALRHAKEIGFPHLNLDIIYATIIDTPKLILDDLEKAFSCGVDHLSCYALTIEQGTKFHATPTVSANDEMLGKLVASTLIDKGFEHYEISNFGKNRCRHNLGYWEGKNYIGAGCGAVGFLNDTRFYPTKDLQKYCENPLFIDEEHLTPDDLKTEKILLGLRSCVGFDHALLTPYEKTKLSYLLQEGKVTLQNEKVYPTDYFLADEMALYIIE